MATLLLIDCQKDFHPGGSLAIPTADEDAQRIAELIRTKAKKISRIVATLDSHQKLHIANPCFWLSSDDTEHPTPFTIITSDDIKRGVWKPRDDMKLRPPNGLFVDPAHFPNAAILDDKAGCFDLRKYVIEYVTRLEARGRFQLCIWPEHCLIGSPGHCVVDCIQEAMCQWSELTGCSVEWVFKGQNTLTEMYSALESDVPVSKDTAFNEALQASLMASERLFVCGQAMSHCVNYTLRDIVAKWKEDELSKVCLLVDCASAVPGFEDAASAFTNDMRKAGVQLKKAIQFDEVMSGEL
jgi:nicotinamidase-related amidase